jgi:HEAT repeat protein
LEALSDPDAKVRSNAAFALGQLGASEAVPVFIDLVTEDTDAWVRKSAAKTLGILKARKAVDALARALDDGAAVVRKNAVRSLGQIATHEAMKALERVTNHEDRTVAEAAKLFLKGVRLD